MKEQTEVDSLELEKTELSDNGCRMNSLKNSHLTEYVEVYECDKCELDNICKACIVSCHGCDIKEKKQKAKLLREVFFCLCHRHKHQCKNSEDELLGNKHDLYSKWFNMPFFICKKEGKEDTEVMCFLCAQYNKITRMNMEAKPYDKDFSYSSTYQYDLGLKSYLFDILETDPKSLQTKAYYDLANYNSHFFTYDNEIIFRDFCMKIFEGNEKLMGFFKNNNTEAIKALEIISIQYKNKTDGLWRIVDNFPLAPSVRIKKQFLSIYNSEFILKLFELPINIQDYLYSFKCYCLEFFIDLYIKPNIEHKYKKVLTNGFCNTTPLHRFLFRDDLAVFFKTLDIPKEDYMNIIDNVFKTVLRSFEEKDPDPVIEVIFKQYYRLLKYMFSYTIDDFSLIEKYINQIISLKEHCHRLPKDLPILIEIFFFAVNDYKFIEYYNDKKEQKLPDSPSRAEQRFIFENNPLNMKLIKLLFSINSRQEDINFPVVLYDLLIMKNDLYIDSVNSLMNCRKSYILEEMIKIKEKDTNFLCAKKTNAANKEVSNNFDEEKEELYEEIDFNFKANDQVLFTTYDEKKYFLSNKFKTDFDKMLESFKIETTLHDELNRIGVNYLHTLREHVNKSLNLCSNVKKNLKQIWFFKNGIFNILSQINEIVRRNSKRFVTADPAWEEIKDLKKNKEDCEELFDEILTHIEFILFKLTEDNSFLCSLMFNDKALRMHLGPENVDRERMINLRVKFLNSLKKDDYKINFKSFIEQHEHKYFNVSLTPFDPEAFVNDIYYTDNINGNLLEMYLGMLKTSSESSRDIVNHFVFTQLIENSKMIEDAYKRYIEHLIKAAVDKKQLSYTFSEKSLKRVPSLLLKEDPGKALFYMVSFLNKVLNNISSCYSYLIVKKLDFLCDRLKAIIPFIDLKPEQKINFVKLYTKFYLKFPYRIYDLTTMNKVEAKRGSSEKDEIGSKGNTEDSESESDSKVECQDIPDNLPEIYPYCQIYDLKTVNAKASSSFYPTNEIYDSTYDDTEDLILETIKKFPSYFFTYKDESFHKNPRFSLRFFLETILNPLCNVLYKLIYFKGPNFENKIKYKIYEAVCLFFKSYKKILEHFIVCGYIKEEYYKLYRTFFKIDKEDKDMNIYFLEIVSELNKTILDFEADNVDFLKTDALLEKFSFAVKKIQFKLKKNKHYRDNMEWSKMGDLFKTVSLFHYWYSQKKANNEINAVVKLIVDNSSFEVNDQKELIKRNLMFEILNHYSQVGEEKKEVKVVAEINAEKVEVEINVEKVDAEINVEEEINEEAENNNEMPQENPPQENAPQENPPLENPPLENQSPINIPEPPSTANLEIENEAIKELFSNPIKSFYLKILNKIVKNDPTFYQKCYLELCCHNKDKPIGKSRIKFVPRITNLSQFVFTEFANKDPDKKNFFLKNYKRELKFLSLLSKKCNDFFIKYFAEYACGIEKVRKEDKDKKDKSKSSNKGFETQEVNFCNFVLNNLSKIIDHISHYDKVQNYLNMITTEEMRIVNKEEFLFSIYNKLFDLNKQFVQSLNIIKDSYDLNNLQMTVETNILENLSKFMKEKNDKLTEFLLKFLELVCLYIFDKKPNGYNEINPNLILKLFTVLYEYIYENYVSAGKRDKNKAPEDAYKHTELIDKLTKNEDIYKDNYFKIFSKIFLYFITLCHYEKKYERLFNTINKYGTETLKQLSYKQKTLSEIVNLFLTIIRMTEMLVKYDEVTFKYSEDYYKAFSRGDNTLLNQKDFKHKSEAKPVPKIVYFQVDSDGVFITPEDGDEFLNLALQVQPHLKLTYFLEYYDYIKTIIQVRKTLTNSQSHLVSFLFKMNYKQVEHTSIFMIMVTNILILFSTVYSITSAVVESPLSNYVFASALIHLIYLFICLANLAYVEMSKFRHLNKIKKEEISFGDYVERYVTKSCYPLLWNFSFGLIATLHPSLHFLYALQLFSIFTLFETMRTVLTAMQLKYKEFLSTGILMLILLLFYSLISLFYFQDQFENPDLNENSCGSLLHCFLSFLYSGVRTGAGFGFPIKSTSENGYWSQFLFDWLFYFTIMLILLNIVNGVIVDTFQSLRTENEILKDRKDNYCFICSFKRTKYEAKGVDFFEHTSWEHNILDYYQFFYKIDNMREEDLNYVESYVYGKKSRYFSDFLPTKVNYRFVKSDD